SLLCAIYVTAPASRPAGGAQVSDAEMLQIVAKHCTMCHAVKPTHESFTEAPKNLVLQSIDDLKRYAPLILSQTVQNKAMPLGNQTAMTEEERVKVGDWIRATR
ncbi:MAG: cysteine desulfurase, partial [Pseudorhodoplanes sp.]